MGMTCGEATMRLLAKYGVTTVFGIPGVHTLDMCRGLSGSGNSGRLRHIQARNEQGAGFMAEGWARATGEVGVAVVISGPGVTNAATALGQCYCDSLPMLLISAEPPSHFIGKGRGVLHEITEQKKVTEPLTALSATARRAQDVPELLARAFSIFASKRPRPVHISVPVDVQAEIVGEDWQPVIPPLRPAHAHGLIDRAAARLGAAGRPLIMIGGGAAAAGTDITGIAESLGAVVVSSIAGKGIVRDDHPQHMAGGTVRPEVQEYLKTADCILAVGTELSETSSFGRPLVLDAPVIRVDIDPHKINDCYPAALGVIADAAPAMAALRAALGEHDNAAGRAEAKADVQAVRRQVLGNLTGSEARHMVVLRHMRAALPDNTVISGDACQIVYTGVFGFPSLGPRQWFYPAGYCALGCALPSGIGAMMAQPDRPTVVVAGDGGFMFTMPELMVAAELGLSLPVVIWENDGLKQIRDDMDIRDIRRVGIAGINPDFEMLARACHCNAVRPDSGAALEAELKRALSAGKPTLIIVREDSPWLTE